MADTELKVVIKAEDKSSGVFSNISGKLGGIGRVAGVAAKAIGTGLVAAAGAFASFGVVAFQEAMEAEEAMQVATKALQNTFDNLTKKEIENLKKELGTTTVSMKQIEDAMADAGNAALKLAFDDEAASRSFAKLFSITKDVSKSQDELKLAMDLAAFSGRGLEEATQALVLVHAGGTKVLKEFGIDVKEGTTAAQAFALMQEKVAGSAETMANTAGGKMAQLSLQWGNFKETVGAALIEAVMPFVDLLTTWAQQPETQKKIEEISQGFANFAQQIAPLVKQVLPAFIWLMEMAGKTIMTVVGFLFKDLPNAIGTAIFEITKIINKIQEFIGKIEEAMRKLRDLVSAPSGGTLNPFKENFALPSWVPKFAEGGVVTRPTLAMVGEGGEPEAIIPFSKMGRMGGTSVNITINGDVTGREVVEYVKDAIMGDLRQNLKLNL